MVRLLKRWWAAQRQPGVELTRAVANPYDDHAPTTLRATEVRCPGCGQRRVIHGACSPGVRAPRSTFEMPRIVCDACIARNILADQPTGAAP